MFSLQTFFASPWLLSIGVAVLTAIYLILTSINPYLPVIVLISGSIGYLSFRVQNPQCPVDKAKKEVYM